MGSPVSCGGQSYYIGSLPCYKRFQPPLFLNFQSSLYPINLGSCFPRVSEPQSLKFNMPLRHTATAIPFIYSFPGKSASSAPISTFMCMWAIYMFPGSVHIFPPAEKADPSWEYIIRSQTHECGNWDWVLDIPFAGNICFKFSAFFLCSAVRIQQSIPWLKCTGLNRL